MEIRHLNLAMILFKLLFILQIQKALILFSLSVLFFTGFTQSMFFSPPPPPPHLLRQTHTTTHPWPHLFTAVVLALLLPLPMLLSHCLLIDYVWTHSTQPKAKRHTCPGERQVFHPVTLSSDQVHGCHSVLVTANPWATRYTKTLWEYRANRTA